MVLTHLSATRISQWIYRHRSGSGRYNCRYLHGWRHDRVFLREWAVRLRDGRRGSRTVRPPAPPHQSELARGRTMMAFVTVQRLSGAFALARALFVLPYVVVATEHIRGRDGGTHRRLDDGEGRR